MQENCVKCDSCGIIKLRSSMRFCVKCANNPLFKQGIVIIIQKMKETWRDIKGYEGLYKVSNFGKIKSFYKNGKTKILKPVPNFKGYERVTLCNRRGNKTIYSVHRLVALAFIENPLLKPEINHINGNKRDNRISNLEWVTGKENCLHRSLLYNK